MAFRSSRPSFVARAAATVVVAAALTATAPASAATAGTTGLLDLACAQQLLREPTRLATALERGVSALLVRLLNDLTPTSSRTSRRTTPRGSTSAARSSSPTTPSLPGSR